MEFEMDFEMVDGWLETFIESCGGTPTEKDIIEEINVVKGDIANEHLWELGYDGDEPNPHTQNIIMLNEYMNVLKDMLDN